MRKSFLIAGAATLAIAVPALAAMHDHGDGSGAMKTMTRADVEAKVKEHFAMVDANKDGAISKEEVEARHAAMRTERMDAHFKAMDKDGNGSISRAEFDAAHDGDSGKRAGMEQRHMSHMGGGMMAMGDRMFDRADANKDSKVTLAEATGAALAHFDKVDANKDGTITPQERMDYRKTMHDQWKAKAGKTNEMN